MLVMDAISADSEYIPESAWSGRDKPIQQSVATFCIGEHGDQYVLDRGKPAEYEAIISCGCRLLFPMPPMTGEYLFCVRHQEWLPCRVIGSYVGRCDTCPEVEEKGFIDSTTAYGWANKHAYGSRGNRNPPHQVFVGRHTEDSVTWKKYTKENN